MIKRHEAAVKAHLTVGEIEVIVRPLGQRRFHRVLQPVTPITEAAPEREGQVNLVKEFVSRNQPFQRGPWIAKLDTRLPIPPKLAPHPKRAEGEERSRGNERVARIRTSHEG